ncbi:MAG TPA: M20 family metallopeptidase [Spirochaetia bacterium]
MADILPGLVELRHALHRIPETHNEERETAALVRRALEGAHLEIAPPLMGTDTVGLLRGGDGPCVLLRSDIDALPVTDRSGTAWSSQRPGRSHACGHDGHMAVLVGVARVLDGLRDRLGGSVRFVFQPAEEEACGGKVLIQRGLLDLDPRPRMAFALHGWVGVPVGSVACAPGPAMAAADTFVIRVRGRGGHAAIPQRAADPVLAAAQVVVALQTVVSRGTDPLEPVVLSICRIEGGHTSNVIPDVVELEGTTRYFNRNLEVVLRDRIRRTVDGVCAAAGCTAELVYEDGYVPLVNDAAAVDAARATVTRLLGPAAWIDDQPPTMGAEDFAFYLEKVPGALLRLGVGEEWPPLHSAEFDFNDRAIETGVMALAGIALDLCAR